MKTKFYTFNQNNSGGYFVYNDEFGVCEYVIIESEGTSDAWDKLVAIGNNVLDMFDFCGCCGERWSNYITDDGGKDSPMIWGEPLEIVESGIFRSRAFVHYIDGTFKEFTLKS